MRENLWIPGLNYSTLGGWCSWLIFVCILNPWSMVAEIEMKLFLAWKIMKFKEILQIRFCFLMKMRQLEGMKERDMIWFPTNMSIDHKFVIRRSHSSMTELANEWAEQWNKFLPIRYILWKGSRRVQAHFYMDLWNLLEDHR